jgi:DNA-binding GntR family transcriptional regulator
LIIVWLSIIEVRQEFAAVLISPVVAAKLSVEPGGPALEVHRTYATSDDEVAQVTIDTDSAARFRHSMTTRRVRG